MKLKNLLALSMVFLTTQPVKASTFERQLEWQESPHAFQITDPMSGVTLKFSEVQHRPDGTLSYSVAQLDQKGASSTVVQLHDPEDPSQLVKDLIEANSALSNDSAPSPAKTFNKTCIGLTATSALLLVGNGFLLSRAIKGTLNYVGIIALADGLVIAVGTGYFGLAACKR